MVDNVFKEETPSPPPDFGRPKTLNRILTTGPSVPIRPVSTCNIYTRDVPMYVVYY